MSRAARRRLERAHPDEVSPAGEVGNISREQGPYTVGQHGRYDVGVVNLLATRIAYSKQGMQLLGDIRAVFSYTALRFNGACAVQDVWHRRVPGEESLRTGHHRQELVSAKIPSAVCVGIQILAA